MKTIQKIPLPLFAEKLNACAEPVYVSMFFIDDTFPCTTSHIWCDNMELGILPGSSLKKASMSFWKKDAGCLDIGEGCETADWELDADGNGAYYLVTAHMVIEVLMPDNKPFEYDEASS